MAALAVRTHGDRLRIGELEVAFDRTLRIPDDGNTYPLPPGLGAFPIRKVEDYAERGPPVMARERRRLHPYVPKGSTVDVVS
jgi:hypothetical protein